MAQNEYEKQLEAMGIFNPRKLGPHTALDLKLPSGKNWIFNPEWTFEQNLKRYNANRGKDPEAYPEVRRGAPAGLRLTLSGATQEQIAATLADKYPWSGTMIVSAKPTGHQPGFVERGVSAVLGEGARTQTVNLYYDPDENVLFTLDEPGATIGDVADVARDVASLGAEIGADALIAYATRGQAPPAISGVMNAPRRIRRILGRGAGTAGTGTAADKAYEVIAESLGGLQDPRTAGEQAVDLGKEAGIRFAAETALGVPLSVLGRRQLKKSRRGGIPREEVQENLERYRRTVGDEPPTLGTVTGPGSRVQSREDAIIELYPEAGGRELAAAVDSTKDQIARRQRDIISRNVEGGAAEPVGTPYEAGVRARQAVEGERVPYSTIRETEPGVYEVADVATRGKRAGGWLETSTAAIGRAREQLAETVPPTMRLYPEAQVGRFGEARRGQWAVPPREMDAPAAAAVAPGRPPAYTEPTVPRRDPEATVGAPRRPSIEVEQVELPLQRTYNSMIGTATRAGSDLTAVKTVLDNPNATLGDLLDLQRRIGPRGTGIPNMAPTDGEKLYAATKETIRQMLKDNPEALRQQLAYDRLAEQHYYNINSRVNKIFKKSKGVDADPEEVFANISGAATSRNGLGNSQLLSDIFSWMEPDDADFVRAAVMDRMFTTVEPKTAMKNWGKMTDEVKDQLAPSGTYWRMAMDGLDATVDDLKLFDRKPGMVGTATKSERDLANKITRGVVGGILTPMSAMALFTQTGSPAVAGASAAAGTALLFKSIFGEMTDRVVQRGRSELLRSPAFYDWVGSATDAFPRFTGRRVWRGEQGLDFLATIVPRIGAETTNASLQDMKDMRELQQIYMEILGDLQEQGAPADEPATILGEEVPGLGQTPGILGMPQRMMSLLGR